MHVTGMPPAATRRPASPRMMPPMYWYRRCARSGVILRSAVLGTEHDVNVQGNERLRHWSVAPTGLRSNCDHDPKGLRPWLLTFAPSGRLSLRWNAEIAADGERGNSQLDEPSRGREG